MHLFFAISHHCQTSTNKQNIEWERYAIHLSIHVNLIPKQPLEIQSLRTGMEEQSRPAEALINTILLNSLKYINHQAERCTCTFRCIKGASLSDLRVFDFSLKRGFFESSNETNGTTKKGSFKIFTILR